MDVEFPKAGRYVVAVSGGVDSVVLLDLLAKWPDLELVVAHFDHGIRPDSVKDRKFVQGLTKDYALPFEFTEGKLGKQASEATARLARYEFLRKMLTKYGAQAIVTAHHQDDSLETAILNMLRGTGRKGLTALQNRPGIVRPLLKIPKAELLAYARSQALKWREDPTNTHTAYLRNYVRHELLPKFNETQKQRLLNMLSKLRSTNAELDETLAQLLAGKQDRLSRPWFNGLPHEAAREVMAAWLRQNGIADFDRKGLERLVVAAKAGRAGTQAEVLKGVRMRIGRDSLALVQPER